MIGREQQGTPRRQRRSGVASNSLSVLTWLGFIDSINCGAGSALSVTYSGPTLAAAIAGSAISFGVQVGIFLLLRLRLSRIYEPRSYLVPERERVPAPPRGIYQWLIPIFTTPNLAFIQKCGLDAYFFLRYLRMLLKFFMPVAAVLLPILLPLNKYSGSENTGLDQLSISNVGPKHVGHVFWAHLILAILVVIWFCYVVFKELRGYIRVRQAYLTSPQHRLRASATTVLVTGIPRKWLTLEALSGLYDVFPGGIKNIWINRNFDELSGKVDLRDKYAKQLEGAETDLIKKCRKAHEAKLKEKAKKEGEKKKSKQQKQQDIAEEDAAAERMAQGQGVSAGDQHETPHGLQDILHDAHQQERQEQEKEKKSKRGNPLGVVSQGLGKVGLGAVNQGLGAVSQGLGAFGRGVGTLGQRVIGDVDNGIQLVGKDFDNSITTANRGQAFITDDDLYRSSYVSGDNTNRETVQQASQREARPQSDRKLNDEVHPVGHVGHTNGDTMQADRKLPTTELRTQGATARNDFARRPNGSESSPSPASEKTLHQPNLKVTRASVESTKIPRSPLDIEEPSALQPRTLTWKLWQNNDNSLVMPSPQPHTAEDDEFPFADSNANAQSTAGSNISASGLVQSMSWWKRSEAETEPEYPNAVNEEWDEDRDEEPRWRHYIEPKDRDTIRLPIASWMFSLPLIGKKVDRIYWLRRELARLNVEIEADQNDVERFPFMNSAFIQFNNQVAAHMACQSLSHHVPQQMAPRLLEISPDDVIWDNMSIKWWERYVRVGVVVVICAALIILYAIPVSITSLIANTTALATSYKWLAWILTLPKIAIAVIQGLVPAILLNVILMLVPIIFRALVRQQGVPTGNSMELGVQAWYFTFLFIQVFFVVTISSGLTQFFSNAATNPGRTISNLAKSLPKGADYFFYYLLVQALSTSASALLQTVTLAFWFLLGPLMDSTPRQKWERQTNLDGVEWGSFFPVFTNFAVIGIIYSVIAPLILVFMLIIFGLFWVAYRYNVLYVYQFKHDTGGLLFPTAINQLFTGIYFLEVCLCGYFFISTGPDGNVACIPQGAIMVVVIVFTVLYQWQLNKSFYPLFQYLPITLEDEAVIRDKKFAEEQSSKFAPLRAGENDGADDRDIQDELEDREKAEKAASSAAEAQDQERAARHRRHSHVTASGFQSTADKDASKQSKHAPPWKTDRWRKSAPQATARLRQLAQGKPRAHIATEVNPQSKSQKADVEGQQTVGDVLFAGFADELEDLTPEERDLLVRYAFQHSALRAKRPVVWIPRDKLGVSDDEIKRAKKMSTVQVQEGDTMVEKTNIWMSNEGTALDSKGRVVFRRSPPDFSNIDLIAL